MRRLSLASAVSVLVLFAFFPTGAAGQAFGVYEQGACAMAQGGATVAEPCADGSAIYFNPAALAGRTGMTLSGGTTPTAGSGTFSSDLGATTAIETATQFPFQAYFQYGLNERLSLGVGAYVPYGLRVTWPTDFEGRFVAYDSDLKTLYVQPTIGYAVSSNVAVGAGLVLARSRLTLNRREDLAAVPLPAPPGVTFETLVDRQTDLADTALSSSWSTGVGANLGLRVTPHDRISVGLRYLTKVTMSYDGRATFDPVAIDYQVTKPNLLGLPVGTPLNTQVDEVLALLPNQNAGTELDMPAQVEAGVSVRTTDRLTLSADYHWVGWSSFDVVRLEFSEPIPPDEDLVQNYSDTSAVRVGAELSVQPGLVLRAGYVYNQAAAPDETVTPILPDAPRNHYTVGVGWEFHPQVTMDVAYQFVNHSERRGRVVNPAPGQLPSVALNSGAYSSTAHLFGLSFRYAR